MKTCSKCGVEKDEAEFYLYISSGKLRSACKGCCCDEDKARYYQDIETSREVKRKSRKRSREKNLEKNRESGRKAMREQRILNPEKVRERDRKYSNTRYEKDSEYRVRKLLRNRINKVLSRGTKSARTLELLGCQVWHLMAHFEFLFRPGMTWENHGPVWHIDHIRPCASFDLRDHDQQRACFHWTNLQPLFALENLQKSDKFYAQPPEPQNC